MFWILEGMWECVCGQQQLCWECRRKFTNFAAFLSGMIAIERERTRTIRSYRNCNLLLTRICANFVDFYVRIPLCVWDNKNIWTAAAAAFSDNSPVFDSETFANISWWQIFISTKFQYCQNNKYQLWPNFPLKWVCVNYKIKKYLDFSGTFGNCGYCNFRLMFNFDEI